MKTENSAQNFITGIACVKAIVDNGFTSSSYQSAFVKIKVLAIKRCFFVYVISLIYC